MDLIKKGMNAFNVKLRDNHEAYKEMLALRHFHLDCEFGAEFLPIPVLDVDDLSGFSCGFGPDELPQIPSDIRDSIALYAYCPSLLDSSVIEDNELLISDRFSQSELTTWLERIERAKLSFIEIFQLGSILYTKYDYYKCFYDFSLRATSVFRSRCDFHSYDHRCVSSISDTFCLFAGGYWPYFMDSVTYIGDEPKLFIADSDNTIDAWSSYLSTNVLVPHGHIPLLFSYSNFIFAKDDLPLLKSTVLSCYNSGFTPMQFMHTIPTEKQIINQGLNFLYPEEYNDLSLISITTPDQSNFEFHRMVDAIDDFFDNLKVLYRKRLLPAKSTPYSSAITYVFEVYMTSQKRFQPAYCVSNSKDFIAMRMDIQFREDDHSLHYVHTISGYSFGLNIIHASLAELYQTVDLGVNYD